VDAVFLFVRRASVTRRWQFEHLTSHFAISVSIAIHAPHFRHVRIGPLSALPDVNLDIEHIF